MSWGVQPEPSDDAERRALLQALEQLLAEEDATAPGGYASPWWRSGLDSLGRPSGEESWRDPRIVEP